MIGIKSGVRTALAAAVFAAFGIDAALAANPAGGTTSTGQTLNVQIDAPANGALVNLGPVAVTGRTSIGPLTVNAAVLYVIDTSGSTNSPKGGDCNGDGVKNAADDINGDGSVGDTLDCEIASIYALNKSLANTAGVSAGVVSFATNATQLDVNPVASGTQAFVPAGADADNNGVRDIEQALKSLRSSGNTNYNGALTLLNSAFAGRPSSEQHVAYFLSDGLPTAGQFTTGSGSPLATAAAAHTRIYTYSVGGDGAGCGTSSPLRQIADTTGGTCTAVSDPTQLLAVLANATPAGISGVSISVDGGTGTAATLDSLGNFAGTASIGSGAHAINATTTASDGTKVTATVTVSGLVTTPDPFGFQPKTAPQGGVLVNSDPITVSGISSGVTVPITVAGGSYSVNGGPFTSNPGNVQLGDVIVAQVTSSTSPLGTATATVTIGGVQSSPSFVVTTDSADLGLVKTASAPAAGVYVNDSITYTITVTNYGPNNAANVTVSDPLPAGLSYVSATPSSGTCAYDGGSVTVTCSIPSIANMGTATVTIVATAISAGSVNNAASVTAGTPDPSAGNNAGASGPVSVNKHAARIAVDAVVGTRASILSLSINLKPRATLTDAATGAPVVGKSISFSANNALLIGTTPLCTATTDSHGVASCSASILATTLPGVLSFGYSGAFAGDSAYQAVSGKGGLLSVTITP